MLLISKWTFHVILALSVFTELSSARSCIACEKSEPKCDKKEDCKENFPGDTLYCVTMKLNGTFFEKGCFPLPKVTHSLYKEDGCVTRTWEEWRNTTGDALTQAGLVRSQIIGHNPGDNLEYCICNKDNCNDFSTGTGTAPSLSGLMCGSSIVVVVFFLARRTYGF